MSKLTLKKELQNLDAQQLTEIILDCYSARKEFSAYFEFFLNPDVKKLSDKYYEKLKKEILRAKRRGYCSARISHVKKMLKEFDSFNPGAVHVIDLMFEALHLFAIAERNYYFTEALANSTAKLAQSIMEYADKHHEFTHAIDLMNRFLSNSQISLHLRKRINSAIEDILSTNR